MPTSIEKLSKIGNQLRIHSIVETEASGSGHPSSCLSAADIAAALFFRVMRYFPQDPKHPNNDRFILSKGHAAPLLYAAWAEAGIIPVEELVTLRKLDSELEGHPTPRLPWVDVATGSLGQGLSAGVGMALAAKLDQLDYRTYVLMGDGEIAEGSVWEAASLASYYKLDNLVAIVDANRLGQSQPTMFEHDVEVHRARFAAFGWNALVVDGHNMTEVVAGFEKAAAAKGQPTVLIARTFKGYGVSFISNKDSWHGKALKKEEMDKAILELKGQAEPALGDASVEIPKPADKKPTAARKLKADGTGDFGPLNYKLGDMVATREAYGFALVRLGLADTRITVVDGDTKNSTFADKFKNAYPERFFECFIAEQNMVGVAVGLAARGKLAFASTFAAFLTRAYDQIRMAAVSMSHVKLVGSHAGVSIGEDGVSQMALEDLAMMRAIYGSAVLYPSDAVSCERLMEQMLDYNGVSYLRASRPKLPVIYGNDEKFPIGGSKVVRQSKDAAKPDKVTVVGAGVTLYEALKAYDELQKEGINITVIDAYSIKPIDADGILKAAMATGGLVITVEDHYLQGGLGDAVAGALSEKGVRVHKLAVHELPHSGKPEELIEKYGISAKSIVAKVKELI
ncbi:MAG: transketolase [Candidatus Gracilibacteria bacterium]|jgi:transketolase